MALCLSFSCQATPAYLLTRFHQSHAMFATFFPSLILLSGQQSSSGPTYRVHARVESKHRPRYFARGLVAVNGSKESLKSISKDVLKGTSNVCTHKFNLASVPVGCDDLPKQLGMYMNFTTVTIITLFMHSSLRTLVLTATLTLCQDYAKSDAQGSCGLFRIWESSTPQFLQMTNVGKHLRCLR